MMLFNFHKIDEGELSKYDIKWYTCLTITLNDITILYLNMVLKDIIYLTIILNDIICLHIQLTNRVKRYKTEDEGIAL